MARKTASESILREKTTRSSKAKIVTDQRFKSLKSISIISILLVIGICVVLNLIIDRTLDKKLTFDSTSVKTNSISRFSEAYLRTLDKKIEIIGLFDRNDTSYEWLDYFVPIMDDYESKGDGKIDLKYVDPEVDPFILNELDPNGLYGLSAGMYVIRCGERMLPIYPYDCFGYDENLQYTYGIYMPVKNYIEVNVTGSISFVASSRSREAYVLSGHGDSSYHAMEIILKSFGFVTSPISLNGDAAKIPSECELLMILEPKTDLTASEKEAILTYLDNHGKVLVVSDFSDQAQVDLTNLNEVTKHMGISLESGVIHENEAGALFDVANPYHSVGFASDYSLQNLSDISSSYEVQNCRYLKVYNVGMNKIEVVPCVVTSDKASVDFLISQIDSTASASTYPVVLVSHDTSVESDQPTMIVIGTSTFTSDSYFTSLNNVNAGFIRSLLEKELQIVWNLGEQATLVPEKSIPSYELSQPLPSSSATWWSLCVMTIIPIGSLACGVYVFQKRRHL